MSVPHSNACHTAAALSLQTTEQLDTLPPPWLAKALLFAQLWRSSGLVDRLQQQVSVERIAA